MPWLCVDYMIKQGVWPMGFSYPDPLANPDQLAKSRPTAVSGDTAGVTTRGVLPHTPVNHTVFSQYDYYMEVVGYRPAVKVYYQQQRRICRCGFTARQKFFYCFNSLSGLFISYSIKHLKHLAFSLFFVIFTLLQRFKYSVYKYVHLFF